MNEPPGARARVGLTGLTVAEYFRDAEGQDVLLFIDNIFRFTQVSLVPSFVLLLSPCVPFMHCTWYTLLCRPTLKCLLYSVVSRLLWDTSQLWLLILVLFKSELLPPRKGLSPQSKPSMYLLMI